MLCYVIFSKRTFWFRFQKWPFRLFGFTIFFFFFLVNLFLLLLYFYLFYIIIIINIYYNTKSTIIIYYYNNIILSVFAEVFVFNLVLNNKNKAKIIRNSCVIDKLYLWYYGVTTSVNNYYYHHRLLLIFVNCVCLYSVC